MSKSKPLCDKNGELSTSTREDRPTESYLGHQLARATMRIRSLTAMALTPFNLSPQEFGMLNQIVVLPGLTQVQIGGRLGIDRTTVVAMLDRLMESGWIQRTADSNDRRVYKITATTAGLNAHRRAREVVMEVEHELTARLNQEQRAALVGALMVLSGHLKPD